MPNPASPATTAPAKPHNQSGTGIIPVLCPEPGLVPQHSRDDFMEIQPRARSFSVLTNSRTLGSRSPASIRRLFQRLELKSRRNPEAQSLGLLPPGSTATFLTPSNCTAKRKKAVKSREIQPQHPATARQSPENPRESSGIFSKRCSELLSPGDDSLLPTAQNPALNSRNKPAARQESHRDRSRLLLPRQNAAGSQIL